MHVIVYLCCPPKSEGEGEWGHRAPFERSPIKSRYSWDGMEEGMGYGRRMYSGICVHTSTYGGCMFLCRFSKILEVLPFL